MKKYVVALDDDMATMLVVESDEPVKYIGPRNQIIVDRNGTELSILSHIEIADNLDYDPVRDTVCDESEIEELDEDTLHKLRLIAAVTDSTARKKR